MEIHGSSSYESLIFSLNLLFWTVLGMLPGWQER
jgi:hypothetical protein